MKIRITCLVNDCVQMSGGFWGEHGLSLLIESGSRHILLDTGTSPEIIDHNLRKLKADVSAVSHVILSHGHDDHSGGLEWVLRQCHRPILVADPLAFEKKYHRNKDGKKLHSIGIPWERHQVERLAQLQLSEEAFQIDADLTVSGRIPRQTGFEKPPEKMFVEKGDALVPDVLLDDRSLIIKTPSGIILVCGCCHAGLVNTLMHVRESFPGKLRAIVGGIHLIGAKEARIQATIRALAEEYQPEEMYFNHCTGSEAYVAMVNAFGKKVKSCKAGSVLDF